jgi:hypothetical protein
MSDLESRRMRREGEPVFEGLSGLKAARVVLPAVALLSACSGIPQTERETRQATLYHKYAGSAVESFTYLGRYDSWTSIGQNQLVVWTTPNEAYLITVRNPCPELPFAQHIGLTQTAPNTVSQRFDFVVVSGDKCWIQSIQPVNYLQMKRDRRQQSAEALPVATPNEAMRQDQNRR